MVRYYKKKKKKKKGASKATMRALYERGGFIPNMPSRFGGILSPGKLVGIGTWGVGHIAKRQGYNLNNSDDLFKFANRNARTLLKGGKQFLNINDKYKVGKTPAPEGGIASANQLVASVIGNTVSKVSKTGMVNTSKYYRTKMINGKNPSKAIRTMASINGTTTIKHFDTMIDASAQGTQNRESLLQSCGFNERRVMAPDNLYTTYSNIDTLYSLASNKAAANTYQQVYGCLLGIENVLKFHNSGSVFPVKVKISYVQMEQLNIMPSAVFMASVNAALGIQSDLALPVRYQFETAVQSGYFNSVALSRRGPGIFGAAEMKSRVDKVASVTKTLSPGDTWEAKEIFRFGSGVNLSALYAATRNSNIDADNPISYYPIIEIEGVAAEAIYNGDTANTYIGTSPAWVSIEASKSYTYVNPSLDQTDWTTGTGGVNTIPSMRAFKKGDEAVQEFHQPVTNIGSGGTQYSVPGITDTAVSDAGQRS